MKRRTAPPVYEYDPLLFVFPLANIHRRHMTKGQRAMAVTVIHPKPGTAAVPEITKQRLSYARTVLHCAPDLVDGVLAAATSPDETYKKERGREAEAVCG